MWKLMWKRYAAQAPAIRLFEGPLAEVRAKWEAVLAHEDGRIEHYWMEKA